MKRIYKNLFMLGTATSILAPVVSVVSCGSNDTDKRTLDNQVKIDQVGGFEINSPSSVFDSIELPNILGTPYVTLKIFPKLDTYDFYNYINIVNGAAHISDELIAKVVKHVISVVNITDGRILWNFRRPSLKEVNIGFKWIGNNEIRSKTYKFKIN